MSKNLIFKEMAPIALILSRGDEDAFNILMKIVNLHPVESPEIFKSLFEKGLVGEKIQANKEIVELVSDSNPRVKLTNFSLN